MYINIYNEAIYDFIAISSLNFCIYKAFSLCLT